MQSRNPVLQFPLTRKAGVDPEEAGPSGKTCLDRASVVDDEIVSYSIV